MSMQKNVLGHVQNVPVAKENISILRTAKVCGVAKKKKVFCFSAFRINKIFRRTSYVVNDSVSSM